MFGRKKEEFTWRWSFGGRTVNTDFDGYEILRDVHKEMFDQKIKIQMLEAELKAIKPVLDSPDYKPPKSRECDKCKFVVYSPWNCTSVIGCRKDCVCEDFKPKKED